MNRISMPAANLYANFDAINRMGYNVNMVTFMANTSVWSQVTSVLLHTFFSHFYFSASQRVPALRRTPPSAT